MQVRTLVRHTKAKPERITVEMKDAAQCLEFITTRTALLMAAMDAQPRDRS